MLSLEGKYLSLIGEQVIDIRLGDNNIVLILTNGHKIVVNKDEIYLNNKS